MWLLYPTKHLLLFTREYSTQPNFSSSYHVTTLLYPTKLLLLFPRDNSTQPSFSSSSHVTTLHSQTSPPFRTWLLYTRVQWFFYFKKDTHTVVRNYLRSPNPKYDFQFGLGPWKFCLFKFIFWAFEFPAGNDVRGGGGTSLQGARALSAEGSPL